MLINSVNENLNVNSCFISCSLPREKRDPLKWDKKNIGKYFSI